VRDYGTIAPQFWIGTTGKRLRGDKDAQILAAYLPTSPHASATGVYHCPVLYMAHETGLTLEEASKALRRLSEEGFCEYDEASETVFVITMAEHQIGETVKPADKRHAWLRKELERMPKAFKTRFLKIYGAAFNLTGEAETASPSEAPSKPLRSQEQDQDQEQDQNKTPTAAEPPRAKRARRDPDPDWLSDFKREYPDRLGDQEWRRAVRAGNARIEEGHTPAEFIAGAKRYHAHCKALDKCGTQYVKQAASFLGPDKHFLSQWPVAKPVNGVPARHQLP
jgi:hypothetical protein